MMIRTAREWLRRSPRHVSLPAAVVTAIAVLAALGAAPVANAAMCFNAGRGGATDGTIYAPNNADLPVAMIGQSLYSGNSTYYAVRRYSDGSSSWSQYMSGGGSTSYATSGNAYRSSRFAAWTTNTSWSVIQYSYC